jgi:hypothetical protein
VATKKNNVVVSECEHEWEKERMFGMDTGDAVCRKCGDSKWRPMRGEDAVQAARRVMDEATGVRPKAKRPTKK